MERDESIARSVPEIPVRVIRGVFRRKRPMEQEQVGFEFFRGIQEGIKRDRYCCRTIVRNLTKISRKRVPLRRSSDRNIYT